MLRRLGLYDNCNLLHGIPKVDAFFSIYLPGERDVHCRLFAEDGGPRNGLADFLGVAQVTTKSNTLEWCTRPTWLPLLQIGPAPVFLDGTNTLAGLMSEGFDARSVVFLPPEVKPRITTTNRGAGEILSRHVSAHRITAEVRAERSSLLVVAQADYHSWKAYLDHQPAPIWRANHAFQAIEIPAGRHEVELVYEDRWFRIGVSVSALTALLCILLWRWLPPDLQKAKEA